MVGDTFTDPRTGRVLEVVKDFANDGVGSDLFFPPPKHDTATDVTAHVKTHSRPRLPGSGRQTRAKRTQE